MSEKPNIENTGADRPDDALSALTAQLSRQVQPPHDLWDAIDARIRPPQRSARGWELALAAGIAAAFVSALFIGGQQRREGYVAAPLAYQQQLDAAYSPLREASLTRYRARAGRLDPTLRRTVDTNLAIIDRALAEIRIALARDPDDAGLGQMLKRTYEQELAVIDAVTPPQTAPDPSRYRGAL